MNAHFGVKAILVIPLSVGGGPSSVYVSLNDMKTERLWPEAIIQRLQLVAQIFANALARKAADQALRESEARLNLAADSAGAGLVGFAAENPTLLAHPEDLGVVWTGPRSRSPGGALLEPGSSRRPGIGPESN